MNWLDEVNWDKVQKESENAPTAHVKSHFTSLSNLTKYHQYIEYANSVFENLNTNQIYRFKEYLKREEDLLDKAYEEMKNQNNIAELMK